MSFFPTPPIYAGIDLKHTSAHVAYLRKTRKGWEIVRLESFAQGEPVKLLDMSTTISALPSQKTLVRSCEIRVKKERDLKAALDFQIEPLLPYPAEKAVIQAQPIEKKLNGTLITAFAVREDHLKSYLERLQNEGLEPEKITCVPYALAALSTLFPQRTSSQFIVHEGDDEITCVLVEKGKLLAARAFDSGPNFAKEVQKTILSFASTHKTKTFETILLLGKESEAIQGATGKTVLLPSTSAIAVSQEDLVRYGLAIGIALAAEGIDFRQKSFAYPHKWRQIKKPLIATIALALLLIGTVAGFGQIALQHKKQAAAHAYFSLLKAERRSLEEAASLTTSEEYKNALNNLENEVRARPDTFPLHPAIPKVREFLAWLSTQAAINVDSLHYAMVKRPDFSHTKDHYKVKVELEFSATHPKDANAFHDLLVSPNSFLDSKEEVQWTAGKGKYRATFYLKDKTRYS